MADWLCIGYPRLVGNKQEGNSDMQEFLHHAVQYFAVRSHLKSDNIWICSFGARNHVLTVLTPDSFVLCQKQTSPDQGRNKHCYDIRSALICMVVIWILFFVEISTKLCAPCCMKFEVDCVIPGFRVN